MKRKARPRAIRDAEAVEQGVTRLRPFRTMFLLDVLQDRDSRPIFLWAAGVVLVGTLATTCSKGGI